MHTAACTLGKQHMAEAEEAGGEWLKLSEAQSQSGLGANVIRRLALQQKIKTRQVGRETLYDAASLLEHVEDDPRAQLQRSLLTGISDAHKQNRELVNTMIQGTGWMKVGLDALTAENTRLTARVTELETERKANFALIDQMQSLDLERRISQAKHDADERRREEWGKKLREQWPAILSALAFRLAPGSRAVQDSVLVGMLSDLDDEKFAPVLEALPLSAEQKLYLRDMRKKLREQDAPALLPAKPSNGAHPEEPQP